MKTLSLLKYSFFLCLALFIVQVSAQQRLILNGAYINIANGGKLVVENPATNAIVKYNGHIITEGENNILKWNLGTTTGTYTIPLGYGANYIPLTFTKTTGTGNGYFAFSTYHTGWDNSAELPTGVLNVKYNGIDNSPFTIDRFWMIDASGYSSKPSLSNLSFTYLDAEHTADGNVIIENELGAQRWNPNINDWGDFIPGVSINTINNTIIVDAVSSTNLYKWWTLPALNGDHFLPVELISFNGECDNNGTVQILWNTASEMNNDYFLLERSIDGIKWQTVNTIKGAGNSNMPINYSTIDETTGSRTYYRLQQTDFDGKSTYSSVVEVNCGVDASMNLKKLEIYPNPSIGTFTAQNVSGKLLQIFNIAGEIIYSNYCTNNEEIINLQNIANGIYIVNSSNSNGIQSAKLMIQNR